MTYRITQSEDDKDNRLTILIEGTLNPDCGQMVEQICLDAEKRFGKKITIDLNGVTFLDKESSVILCRLKNQHGFSLSGCHLFTKKVIDETDSKSEG
jgi:hypothetical protein